MHIRKRLFLWPVGAAILLLVGIVSLSSTAEVDAQCGSQASSCKNCHETQAKDPVNNDGTGWHQSHAFGDFCYLCHAGNNQSMDQDQAHTGMVAPMSDVQAACASCHPADLVERADVYAAALGVEAGMGGGSSEAPTSGGGSSGGTESSQPAEPAVEAAPPSLVVQSAEVVDYNQQYDETVLGVQTINWGNVILWLIILVIAVGGGFFIYWNERRQRGLPFLPAGQPTSKPETRVVPVVEGYSSEISGLLPLIAELDPRGLHSLKKILAEPDQANELLRSLSSLDPELIRQLRSMDREAAPYW